MNNIFEELNKINVNEHTEKRKGSGLKELTYLSWCWAYAEMIKRYPDMQYEIVLFKDKDGVDKPYIYDENTGYMVETRVTIGEMTLCMWLPVMDSANKAMKKEKYTYQVKDYYNKGQMIEKEVEPATMFDINKTIMRCLTKNFAMFGLGLYIFAGEDIPEDEKTPEPTPAEKAKETREANKLIEEELKKKAMDMLAWLDRNKRDLEPKERIKVEALMQELNRGSLLEYANKLAGILMERDKIGD